MKNCKYCHRRGKFFKSLRKVLCHKHANAMLNGRIAPLLRAY